MRITVTTPTGNIGKVVAKELLDAGVEVILPCRSPERVKGFTERGAVAMQGSMEDAAFLTEACRGSDALFWLTPPDFTEADFRAYQNRMGRAAATAVRNCGIKRVVNLSSIGAQHPDGTGPIKGLHDVENLLNDTPADVMHLRPTFFMENFIPMVQPIAEAGSIFMPVKGHSRVPMVATRDVAAVAAAKLRDSSWSGTQIFDVLGPADLSFDEAATAIAEGLGREVKFVTAEPGATKEMMLGFGMSQGTADLMLELYRAIDSGILTPDRPRSPETTTPTTLTQWARDVMKPMLD